MESPSLFIEIPADLHQELIEFLKSHPNWDLNRCMTASLSLMLMQNSGKTSRVASQHYLASVFDRSELVESDRNAVP